MKPSARDRQHQMPGDVERARKALLARGDGLDARCREPAQLHGEDDAEHQAEPEARHGVERQRADRKQRGRRRCRAARRRRCRAAEPSPKDERDGAAHQPERVGQAFEDDVEDRPAEQHRPAEIEAQERGDVEPEPREDRLVEAVAFAQRLHQRRVAAADRQEIGVDRVAGRGFEQEEGADDDDQQHRDAADQPAPGEKEGTSHAGSRPREKLPAVYHDSSSVSAQLETAQRGLLETFFTLVRATVMKPHSATLISGRSSATSFWNCLEQLGARRDVDGLVGLVDQRVERGVGVAALVGEGHAVGRAALDQDGGRDRRVAAEHRRRDGEVEGVVGVDRLLVRGGIVVDDLARRCRLRRAPGADSRRTASSRRNRARAAASAGSGCRRRPCG